MSFSLNPFSLFSISRQSFASPSFSSKTLQKCSYAGACIALSGASAEALQNRPLKAVTYIVIGSLCYYNAWFLGKYNILGDVVSHIEKETQLNKELKKRDEELQELSSRLEEIATNFSQLGEADQSAVETILPRIDSAKKRESKTQSLLTQLQNTLSQQTKREQKIREFFTKEQEIFKAQMKEIQKLKDDEAIHSQSLQTQLESLLKQNNEMKSLVLRFEQENTRLQKLLTPTEQIPPSHQDPISLKTVEEWTRSMQRYTTAMEASAEKADKLLKQLEDKK